MLILYFQNKRESCCFTVCSRITVVQSSKVTPAHLFSCILKHTTQLESILRAGTKFNTCTCQCRTQTLTHRWRLGLAQGFLTVFLRWGGSEKKYKYLSSDACGFRTLYTTAHDPKPWIFTSQRFTDAPSNVVAITLNPQRSRRWTCSLPEWLEEKITWVTEETTVHYYTL